MSTSPERFSESIRERGKSVSRINKRLIKQLKQNTPKNLDDIVHNIHDAVFENTDCLQCANCCKTTSPTFYAKDIERISKRLRLKPVQFTERYLNLDEDGDYVLKSAPCPFLEEDNRCSVYEDRPGACRTYPHTDRKRFHQVLDLTVENSFICPAVQTILEKLDNQFNPK